MVGAFGIPTVAAVGILFVLPSVGRSTAFYRRGGVLLYPLPPNPALWAVCGPVTGLFLLLFQNLFVELSFNGFFGPGLQFFKFCVRECGGVRLWKE